MSGRCLWIATLTIALAWSSCVPFSRAGETATSNEVAETALEKRAKELIRAWAKTDTKEERKVVRASLLAMADSLEAAGGDVLAAHCLERASSICYYFAEYDRAIEICDRGIAVARRSGDRKRVAALLNAKAINVSASGNDKLALGLQHEVLEVRREMGDTRGEGITWHNLAYSYRALFLYPEAIEAAKNAVRLHRQVGNEHGLAGSGLLLSNALWTVGRRREALVIADSAIAVARRVGRPELISIGLGSRGLHLLEAGRPEDSLADLEESIEVAARAGYERNIAVSRVNRASALVVLGRCQEALADLRNAWSTLESTGSRADETQARSIEGSALIECGRIEEGRAVLVEAIERLDAVRDSLNTDLARAEATRTAQIAYGRLAMLDAISGRQDAAWLAIENGSAWLWREKLALPSVATVDDLKILQRKLNTIDAIAVQYAEVSSLRGIASVIRPTSVTTMAFPLPPGFGETIEGALDLMSSGADDEAIRPILSIISSTILEPIASHLSGRAKRLVVIAGPYGGVPFEALYTSENGETLGSRYAMAYSPSVSTFLHLDSRQVRPGGFVCFADPTVEAHSEPPPQVEVVMRSGKLQQVPLPQAREEVERIATPSARVFIGAQARKSVFLSEAADAAVVHFATHALVDEGHPRHSVIVLAGLDETRELGVSEIESTSLGADLVTLSGCTTAGGYIVPGEGALGLASAFHMAGARSVVASRWDVEDKAARRFMELFYADLRNGVARDVALQRACATMKTEGYPHRDRSAFALSGVTAEPVAALAVRPRSVRPVLLAGCLAIFSIASITMALRLRSRRRVANQ